MLVAIVTLAALMATAAGTAVVLAVRNGGLRAELAKETARADRNAELAADFKQAGVDAVAETARARAFIGQLEKEIKHAQAMCVAGGEPGAARDALLGLLRRPFGDGTDGDAGGVGAAPLHGDGAAGAAEPGNRRPHPMPD